MVSSLVVSVFMNLMLVFAVEHSVRNIDNMKPITP